MDVTTAILNFDEIVVDVFSLYILGSMRSARGHGRPSASVKQDVSMGISRVATVSS